MCNSELYWHGCFKGTYDLICSDSFAHPAKMAPGLCFKILEHLEELGILKEGDTILDPMAGTGLTAITAGAKGYPSITVELEEKFINFERQNKEYAERKLYKELAWQIIQGDSRRLSELLKGNGHVAVTSPPYETLDPSQTHMTTKDRINPNHPHYVDGLNPDGYGQTVGQIGVLLDKPPKSITSPPYDNRMPDSHNNIANIRRQHHKEEYYGSSSGQIANEETESYLSAMSQVYAEIAKVSDVLVVVIKNPTRNKQLRRLDLDTIRILKETGWTIHCQHRALLFEEQEHPTLFGDVQKKIKGRMSFFKRLSWQNGQPVASWEDILVCVRKHYLT